MGIIKEYKFTKAQIDSIRSIHYNSGVSLEQFREAAIKLGKTIRVKTPN